MKHTDTFIQLPEECGEGDQPAFTLAYVSGDLYVTPRYDAAAHPAVVSRDAIGYTGAEDADDGIEKVRIRRPEDGSTTNEIGIENGIRVWPWGSPIRPATDDESDDDPHAIAAQLERFMGPRANFRTSGG